MALTRQTGEGVALTANILQHEAAVGLETECLLFLHKALTRQPSLCTGSGKRVTPLPCRQVCGSRQAGNFCASRPQGRNPTPLLLRYGKGRGLPREDFSFSANTVANTPIFAMWHLTSRPHLGYAVTQKPSPARLFHALRDFAGYILGARSGGRTRTAIGREILSLLCLPVPPSGRVG